MYILYTDKTENFECTLKIEGAKLSDSKARLVAESKDFKLLFEGSISKDGEVNIPISKVKNILGEGETGNLKLEVIAEDTYFEPWSDKFEVKTSKKVTVAEVKDNSETKKDKKVVVEVKRHPIGAKSLAKEYYLLLKENNISKSEMLKHSQKVSKLTDDFVALHEIESEDDIKKAIKTGIKLIK